MLNKKVKVQINMVHKTAEFEGVVIEEKGSVLMVERSTDKDTVQVRTDKPAIFEIEVIGEVKPQEKEVYNTLRDIKKDVMSDVKYEDDVIVDICVYESDESGEDTFDVEITYYADGKDREFITLETHYELKGAKKRATAVLKSVKGWFEFSENVTVKDKIKHYHM